MTVMGLTMTAGGIYIALTIFFNVFGTYLARVYAFVYKAVFMAMALVSYTVAFVTWSKVLKVYDLGFASSVITGSVLTISNLIAFCFLNEVYSMSKLFFTALIVVGVIGVNVCQS